jgi:hypothetical protein
LGIEFARHRSSDRLDPVGNLLVTGGTGRPEQLASFGEHCAQDACSLRIQRGLTDACQVGERVRNLSGGLAEVIALDG